MRITALAIGSRGDVQPFVELGKEMVKRGHSFKVAAFPRFKEYVESSGLDARAAVRVQGRTCVP